MGNVERRDVFEIDQEDLSDAIALKLKLDSDTVTRVLDAEMAFLESKGLVVEEELSRRDEARQLTFVEPERAELTAYIVANTGIKHGTVAAILSEEVTYLDAQ